MIPLLTTIPPKWHLDTERAAQMMTADASVRHFGSTPSTGVIEAYYPVEIGAGLVVSRYTTTALPDGANAAIAAIIADFKATQAADGTDKTGDAKVADKQLELTLGWREAPNAMRFMYRMVVAASATGVAAVIGQCIERDDANIEHVSQCRQALMTIDPGIAIVDRVGIALPGSNVVVPPAEAPAGTGMKLGGGETLSDGAKLKLAPITIPQEASPDRRPYYIGLGVLVLAAAIWWNRRSREKFDDDKDDDADELRDAARGEGKDV